MHDIYLIWEFKTCKMNMFNTAEQAQVSTLVLCFQLNNALFLCKHNLLDLFLIGFTIKIKINYYYDLISAG